MPLKDGRVVWHHWTARAICHSLGNRVENQGTGRDVTERVQHQEEIQRLNWGLENRVAERTAQLDGTVELRRDGGASFHIVLTTTRQWDHQEGIVSGKRVLLVEDENIIALDLRLRIENLGHTVVGVAHSGEMAVKQTAELAPDLVLMDLVPRGAMDGVEAASAIRQSQETPIMYLSAYSDEKTRQRMAATRPLGYLVKPFDDAELESALSGVAPGGTSGPAHDGLRGP